LSALAKHQLADIHYMDQKSKITLTETTNQVNDPCNTFIVRIVHSIDVKKTIFILVTFFIFRMFFKIKSIET